MEIADKCITSQNSMIIHYLRTFYRKFTRSRTTYLINLVGLSGGLACGLLIYLWIYGELHVDRFYGNTDRLYSVMINDHQPDRVVTANSGSIILGKALKNTFPEVEYSVVTTPAGWFRYFSISYADKAGIKGTGNFAGKDFFHVFPRYFLSGNASSALSNMNSIAISKGLAQKLFHGTDSAVGKVLKWKWNALTRETVVTGVYEDFPANATIQYDFVVSIDSWEEIIKATEANADLSGGPFNTFVVLNKGVNPDIFNRKIANIVQSAIPKSTSAVFVAKYADNYLHGKYVNGVQEGGRIEYVRLFSIIAICVLVIAFIIFVNLSTAKASERMNEIGIKKTLGATRYTLIRQFLGESILLCFISLFVAVLLVVIVYPEFRFLTGMQFILVWNPWLITSVLVIILLTGVIAGIYPALYLSGFTPVVVLRGKWLRPGAGLSIRKALVLFQFAASVVFIVVVMIVYNQVKFVLSKSPGYEKDNIIYFEMQGQVAQNPDVFLSELKKIPGVLQASTIQNTIVVPWETPRPGVYWEGKNADDKLKFAQMPVSYDAIETLGIKMVTGRSFSRKFADTSAIILNETAVSAMGLTNPIGKTMTIWGKQKTIVGIAKDFHFNSFHEKIMPFIFKLDPGGCMMMMIRVAGEHQQSALEAIKTSYRELNPGNYFDYRFLDEDYQQQYASEKLVATLCKYFAGLTILISCLGLFGLTVFAVEQRIKEIGIRRTLGASRIAIVHLLSVDFAKIIGISILIGLPVSYIVMKRWLNEFAYRIELDPTYFLVGGLITFLIAALTIGIQSVRASMTKPVDCLKNQ
jgi:putative ABC transport system permease protein